MRDHIDISHDMDVYGRASNLSSNQVKTLQLSLYPLTPKNNYFDTPLSPLTLHSRSNIEQHLEDKSHCEEHQ